MIFSRTWHFEVPFHSISTLIILKPHGISEPHLKIFAAEQARPQCMKIKATSSVAQVKENVTICLWYFFLP